MDTTVESQVSKSAKPFDKLRTGCGAPSGFFPTNILKEDSRYTRAGKCGPPAKDRAAGEIPLIAHCAMNGARHSWWWNISACLLVEPDWTFTRFCELELGVRPVGPQVFLPRFLRYFSLSKSSNIDSLLNGEVCAASEDEGVDDMVGTNE